MLYCCIAFPIICILCFFWYFSGSTSNHTGMDFFLLIVPLLAFLHLSINFRKKRAWLAWTAIMLNTIAILFFYIVDEYNIMVNYETWIRRGMPEPAHIFQKLLAP